MFTPSNGVSLVAWRAPNPPAAASARPGRWSPTRTIAPERRDDGDASSVGSLGHDVDLGIRDGLAMEFESPDAVGAEALDVKASFVVSDCWGLRLVLVRGQFQAASKLVKPVVT